MFNFFKKPQGKNIIFTIRGMHCNSCAMNIDGELEDTQGVFSAETNYAKSRTTVTYDPTKVSEGRLKEVIKSLGYLVVEST